MAWRHWDVQGEFSRGGRGLAGGAMVIDGGNMLGSLAKKGIRC